MKTVPICTALGTIVFSANLYADEDLQAKYLMESRQTAQEFVQKLGGALKRQLQAGGPESAIGVCKEIAPALAKQYSTDSRVVKRVSLKPRNKSLGTPDAWEERVLHNFDQRTKSGRTSPNMEISAITQDENGKWFRYMKAIPTQPMCLQCHGQPNDIPAGVKALLAKEYPNDKATGYSVGMIRGAVSIKQAMD